MRPWIVITLLLLIIPVFSIVSEYLIFRFQQNTTMKIPDHLTLQEGDLVFRRGKSMESFAVVMAEQKGDFSHIGLIVMEEKMLYVIHIEPDDNFPGGDRVRKEPLQRFLDPEKASHFAIYRSHLDRKNLAMVAEQARDFFRKGSRFDHSYNLQTDQALYCTELVLKAYQRGSLSFSRLIQKTDKVRLLMVTKNILMPEAFIRSHLFYKICAQ